MNDSSCIFEIIYNTIQQIHNIISVRPLYEMAGVSQSSYYAWFRAAPSGNLRKLQNRDGFELILDAYKMRDYSKDAKGIYMALLHMEPPVIMNPKRSDI